MPLHGWALLRLAGWSPESRHGTCASGEPTAGFNQALFCPQRLEVGDMRSFLLLAPSGPLTPT